MKLKETANPVVLAVFLALVGAISALILAVSDNVTREPIRANSRKNMMNALKDVLPPFVNQPDENILTLESEDGVSVRFYGGLNQQGQLSGIAAETVSGNGYAGAIRVMIGFNPDGVIRSVLVTEHKETPGLGSVVCARKNVVTIGDILSGKKETGPEAGLPPNQILDQFSGRSAAAGDDWKTPWTLKKEGGPVEYMTGATITSRAVTEAVNRAAVVLVAQRNDILRKLGGKQQ